MKTAIVTGSSRGIGKATVTALSGSGYRVLGVSRTNGSIDVRSEYLMNELVDDTEKQGTIDALINNAGYHHPRTPLHQLTNMVLSQTFDTNVFGPFFLMRKVIPVMLKQNDGVIINVASTAVINLEAGLSLYSASKAALAAITVTIAKELRGTNVLCVTVCPGATNTTIYKEDNFSEKNPSPQSPELVAGIINEIVTKREAASKKVNPGDCIMIKRGSVWIEALFARQ